MEDTKIQSFEELEKVDKVIKTLSFERDQDVIVLAIDTKDELFPLDKLKSMVNSIQTATNHKCIVVPDNILITTSTKEKTIKKIERMLDAIKEIPDDAEPTEISW